MMIDYTGQQIGNYRLVRLLGQGGFASVYLGQHERIATQQVAIKILHLFDVNTQQFQLEAETTAALEHPHIVRLFDFHIQQGTPMLVMAYAPNGSLRTRHPQGTKVPLATVLQYVKEIASALQYAHDQNIIHRDIKPENMLIGRHSELLLSDFGISVLSKTGRTSLQSSYGTGGTAYYMSPEQFRGKPEKASDQYALGITVYEWLCGTLPFPEGDFIQLGYQHNHESVPPLRQHLSSLSPQVETVVLRALAKNPQERFPTVKAFADALEAAYSTSPASIGARPNISPVKRGETEREMPPIGTKLFTCTGQTMISFVLSVMWSPDGTKLASGSVDSTMCMWEANSGKLLRTFSGHANVVGSVAWSLDGSQLASGSWDSTVRVWEANSGRLLHTLNGHSKVVASIAWSPDGTRLASGSSDQTVCVWEASSGKLLLACQGHTGEVQSVAWSPDGMQLASGSWDKTVHVWEMHSGKLLRTYTGHTEPVRSVAWSPNGDQLVSGDNTVRVWDAHSGQLLRTYSGHTNVVSSVAWSPDGTRLASSSYDKTVQVWEVKSGRLLYTYTGHTEVVFSVAWSPDGTRLASGSNDKTVQVWQAI